MFCRVLVCVASLALVAACDDGGADPVAVETVPQATAPATSEVPDDEDGILRIGLLLPRSGPSAAIGEPLIAAALVTAEAINTAGGVLGRPIEVVTDFDEGGDESTARDSIAGLIERDVDAVVGPASSTITLAVLDDLLSAGILTCSPTATAQALDDFPKSDLFIRTAPSDSLQAIKLAQLADDTGARSVAVTYIDDPYGRQLGEATITALRSRGLEVDVELPFSAQDEGLLVDEATMITSSDVDVVIVLGDGEHGARMLSEIGEATGIAPGDRPPDILVNDAIRHPPSPQLIQALATDVRERITGVSPLAHGTEEGEPTGAFATNSTDCVNLIALAAVAADSDDAGDMRATIVDVSDSGINCRTFAECTQQSDLNIDYDGPGGRVQLGQSGDPVDARFDHFGFDEFGVDVSKQPVTPGQPSFES